MTGRLLPGEGRHPRWQRRLFLVTVVALLLLGVGVAVRLSLGPGTPGRPVGVTGAWSLLWDDEFDGDALDRQRWQPDRSGGGQGDPPFNRDAEAAWFSPQDVAVRDGYLVFTVAHRSRTFDGTSYPLSSGMVQATDGALLRPGSYIEARVEVPTCEGCWPAFWAVPTDRWPPEIDAFEYSDTATQQRPTFNYYDPTGTQSGPTEYGSAGTDYRRGFHVYGLLWTGTEAIPYLDGRPYRQVAATQSMTRLPLAVILNLSVSAGADPAAGTSMKVDWVRAWTAG